jgi:hypothetical protein
VVGKQVLRASTKMYKAKKNKGKWWLNQDEVDENRKLLLQFNYKISRYWKKANLQYNLQYQKQGMIDLSTKPANRLLSLRHTYRK